MLLYTHATLYSGTSHVCANEIHPQPSSLYQIWYVGTDALRCMHTHTHGPISRVKPFLDMEVIKGGFN